MIYSHGKQDNNDVTNGDANQNSNPDISLDKKGFVIVGEAKAPFKLDPTRRAITFVEKDRRHQNKNQSRVVSVSIEQLTKLLPPT